MLISGEAGIGKSALVETVGAQAKKEGFTRTTFRCSPYYTNSALYPMIEQIKRRLRGKPAIRRIRSWPSSNRYSQITTGSPRRSCRCSPRCSRCSCPRVAILR